MEQSATDISRRDFGRLMVGVAAAGLLTSCGVEQLNDNSPNTPTPAESLDTPTSSAPVPSTSETLSTPAEIPTTTVAPPTTATSEPIATPTTTSRVTTTLPTKPPQDVPPNLPLDRYIVTGPADRPNVSITVDDFDSSSSPAYLQGLLKLGKQKGVKFTLFPIGQALLQYDSNSTRALWRQAVDEGHIIGNHTWDHDETIATKPAAQIKSNLDQQRRMVNTVLGVKDYGEYLMRPPGGSGGYHVENPTTSYEKKLEKEYRHEIAVLKQLGYWMTMWSTDSNDKNGNMVTPGTSVRAQDNRFLKKIFNGADGSTYEKVQNGSIILVHPNTLSLNGMSRLIDGLHARQYACLSVPGLFA